MTLDLLEQRRTQLGVPADRVIPVRPLLMCGGVVGVACIGLVALAGVWLSWRQSQLQQQVSHTPARATKPMQATPTTPPRISSGRTGITRSAGTPS